MPDQTQQEYLNAAKAELAKVYPKITWDEFAELCGIEPRAFKTYRMPKASKDYRTMQRLARDAVERALKNKLTKKAKGA